MDPSVFREREDESDLCGVAFQRNVQKTYDSCWGRIGLAGLVVHGIDDVTPVWLDHFHEKGPEEFLL